MVVWDSSRSAAEIVPPVYLMFLSYVAETRDESFVVNDTGAVSKYKEVA